MFSRVHYPGVGHQPKLDVVEIRIKTMPPDDPYGIVCGGFLKIKGPCCSFVVRDNSELQAVNGNKQCATIASLPSIYDEPNIAREDHILLLLLSVTYPHLEAITNEGCCLVLKQATEEEYTRVAFVRLRGPSLHPGSGFQYKKEEWPEKTITIL